MKSFLLAMLVLASTLGAAQADINKYQKIQIRPLENNAYESTRRMGLILNWNEPDTLGIFGGIKVNNKYKYDLLGVAKVSTISVGLTGNFGIEDDRHFTINHIEGQPLSSICGEFYGGKIGLALLAGTMAFSAVNSDGVVVRSNSKNHGFAIDLSVVRVKVECLNEQHENWEKIVRF